MTNSYPNWMIFFRLSENKGATL